MQVDDPLFTVNELGLVAGLPPRLVHLWLQRGVIEPSRLEHLAVHRRALFSLLDIFTTRLTRVLTDELVISTGAAKALGAAAHSAKASSLSSLARRLVEIGRDRAGGWMWGAARHAERGKTLPIYAGVTWRGECWEFWICADLNEFKDRFGAVTAFAVIPVGEIFAAVYRECEAIYSGKSSKVRRRKPARD